MGSPATSNSRNFETHFFDRVYRVCSTAPHRLALNGKDHPTVDAAGQRQANTIPAPEIARQHPTRLLSTSRNNLPVRVPAAAPKAPSENNFRSRDRNDVETDAPGSNDTPANNVRFWSAQPQEKNAEARRIQPA